MPTNVNTLLKRKLRPGRPPSRTGRAALGANGGAKVRYDRPTQQNIAALAARTSRLLHGLPEERQTRRQKKAAKRARQVARR